MTTPEIRDYTDAELLAIPPIVIKAGYIDDKGTLRDRHEGNPFNRSGVPVERNKEPKRHELVRRWFELHDRKKVVPTSEPGAPVDEFDSFINAIDDKAGRGNKLFYRSDTEPEYKGADGFAAFPIVPVRQAGSPEQRALEDHWEQYSSIPMHENQVGVVMAPKEKGGFRFVRPGEKAEVPKFEESEKAEVPHKLRRGD